MANNSKIRLWKFILESCLLFLRLESSDERKSPERRKGSDSRAAGVSAVERSRHLSSDSSVEGSGARGQTLPTHFYSKEGQRMRKTSALECSGRSKGL